MASNDILTRAEAKAALQIGAADTSKDNLLDAWITSISTRLDKAVGPVVYATITAELHDGGYSHVFLDKYPVNAITQVVEYDGTTAGTLTAQSNSSQTANQYMVTTRNGRLVRTDSGVISKFPNGMQNVLVSYTAGRFTQGTITDERFRTAAMLMLENAWRQYTPSLGGLNEFDVPQQNFPTFIIPKAAKSLLANEWQEGAGF